MMFSSLRSSYPPPQGSLPLTYVDQLLVEKGHQIWIISPDDSVLSAIYTMSRRGVGCLAVVSDHALLGLITERDYARKVLLAGRSSQDTHVSEVMSDALITVRPKTTTAECLSRMTAETVRYLPVLSDGELVGMLSSGDILRSMMRQQGYLLRELERYVAG